MSRFQRLRGRGYAEACDQPFVMIKTGIVIPGGSDIDQAFECGRNGGKSAGRKVLIGSQSVSGKKFSGIQAIAPTSLEH